MWIPSNYSLCLSLYFPGRIKHCGIVVIKKYPGQEFICGVNGGKYKNGYYYNV